MSETERRTAYNDERILIEAARILDPQFNAQGIILSGAQVELLRNVVAYLRRDTTFVDEYQSGYYLKADANDWDDISAVVADLEDKLMVVDNTIWGYNAPFNWSENENTDGSDPFYLVVDEVPAGELWIVETFVVWHNLGTDGSVQLSNDIGGSLYHIAGELTVPTSRWYGGALTVTLAEGDELKAAFNGFSSGKAVKFRGLGYIMKVPE